MFGSGRAVPGKAVSGTKVVSGYAGQMVVVSARSSLCRRADHRFSRYETSRQSIVVCEVAQDVRKNSGCEGQVSSSLKMLKSDGKSQKLGVLPNPAVGEWQTSSADLGVMTDSGKSNSGVKYLDAFLQVCRIQP
jgi:hypothetical protein